MPKRVQKAFDNTAEVALRAGFASFAGIDEAGRGCLAGPVCAAAVIMPERDFALSGINDSKKLARSRREELYHFITSNAVSYAVSFVPAEVIDEINILQATFLAMKQAVEQLNPQPELLLIDGNRFAKGYDRPYKTIIKGDSLCISIAAASILAKVERDRFMMRIAEELPEEFDFAHNVGYGVQKHLEAIAIYGPTKYHRRSFLKKRLDARGSQEAFL
ncbi:MAG: ribonuclease HII [Chloroflexota bacterium]